MNPTNKILAATLLLFSSTMSSETLAAGTFGKIHTYGSNTEHIIQIASDIPDSNKIGPEARNFIDDMAMRGIGFLADENLPIDRKKVAFKKLLEDSFDMNTLGRFALGRYWRVATPQQRQEYQTLFRKMVVEVYAARFEDYKGQTFETKNFRTDGKRDVIVTSHIIPQSGTTIQVDWRVRYKDGKYKVVDIIVEGVSMAVTQRADFSAVIQRGGGDIETLLAHLKEKESE